MYGMDWGLYIWEGFFVGWNVGNEFGYKVIIL